MEKKRITAYLGKALLWLALLVLVLALFFHGLKNVTEEVSEQGRTKLEDAVRRAAVACYAAEGAYPPDVTYMIEHYGLSVDESRYIVHYDIFAENLMPDITVLDNVQ
ncbi:MAG: hypothetical protein Q4A88_04705 [Clostridia bacterium]|nr:hypothetical protein [Clostridia bacterium]